MAIDMKKIISDGAERLLTEKRVKRLTVKDIVEECNISRQTFYYHFEGIPEMVKWNLETKFDELLQRCVEKENLEDGLYYVASVVLNVRPAVERALQSNYRDELEQMVRKFAYGFFEGIMDKWGLYKDYSPEERKMIARYHAEAFMGLGRSSAKEEVSDMDQAVHFLYRMLMGEIHAF